MSATKAKPKTTPLMRAAAVIVAVGAESASQVYKHLSEEEVEKLSLEVAKLQQMEPEEQHAIIEEFYGLCVTQKMVSEGGALYARDVLEKAFGKEKAAELMSRIAQSLQTRAFEFIRKASYKNLMMMIQNEHPQTIAFVLSYSTAEQASKVLSELPKSLQISVVERIAKLESVSPEIVQIVEAVFEKKFATLASVDMTELGGVSYVADIINHTDRTTEKHIFDELSRKNPVLSDNIRKLMFVFEDIVTLDDVTIQRVLREVESQDLVIAIKGSGEEVRTILLNNMSTRARENVLSDMEFLRNVRLRDVEEAQQKIVNIIRQLEESGEIVVARGGEDDILV